MASVPPEQPTLDQPRACVAYGMVTAAGLPSTLVLLDSLVIAPLSGRTDESASVWLLVVLLPWVTIIAAPFALAFGALGGLLLSWWAARTSKRSHLSLHAAVLGASLGVAFLSILSAIDDSWIFNGRLQWPFLGLTAFGGWVTCRAVFPPLTAPSQPIVRGS